MTVRRGHAIVSGHGRGRAGANQARLVFLVVALLAAACSPGQGPEAIGSLFSRTIGPAFEGREAPPRSDQGFPNLGTIPPRPTLADPAVRDALTAALAEERQRSRNPLDPETRPEPLRPSGTPGDRLMPARPPGPPPLAVAAPVPWESPLVPAAPTPRVPAALSPPPAVAPEPPRPAAAAVPSAAPALPEMGTTPPPPPPAELLAPGAGPPPPPSPDLLAPRTR
jgi:hypothetical protein